MNIHNNHECHSNKKKQFSSFFCLFYVLVVCKDTNFFLQTNLFSFLLLTNHPGHVVEGEALVAADGEALVVVLPVSEEKELAAGAGLHA